MKAVSQIIPDNLIYEMVNGTPIYYKCYQDFLAGKKQLAEIMGSSILQSLIISRFLYYLQTQLGFNYEVLTNEIGIQFEKKSWRAADLAIIKTSDIKKIKSSNKYLDFPPEIVVEIDTKADLISIQNPLGYYHEKTEELLNFGVKKVIWIFTESQKVMIATPDNKWEISNWSDDINVLDDVSLKIEELLQDRK